MTDVDAPPVWPVTRGKSLSNGPAIHVAIIDTGIDYNFPELSAAFKGGHNFIARNERSARRQRPRYACRRHDRGGK